MRFAAVHNKENNERIYVNFDRVNYFTDNKIYFDNGHELNVEESMDQLVIYVRAMKELEHTTVETYSNYY